mgnify:FL=1
MNSNSIFRIRIVLVFVCFFSFIIIGKLYFVQIVKGNMYSEKADKQYIKPSTVLFSRGSIFFQSKDGTKNAVATLKDGYTLVMNPKILKDPNNAYQALSPYLNLNKDSFIEKASKVNDQYEELQKRLDQSTGQSINALRILGINAVKDSWRIYPADSLAAHTIGLIGYDDKNKIAGRYGLERYYENILTRQTGIASMNFFAELFSGIKNSVFKNEEKTGDIVTSIEPTVEEYLEKTLEEVQDKWSSDSIGGIIMDPNTGLIYAMSARPTFNPNDLKDIKDPKVFSNPLVEEAYEMGSIIKPLTMMVGIDSGAIKTNSTYIDKGFLELNGKKIANFDGKARGEIPMQEILSQSLNIGVATIALKIGGDTFSNYFKKFGFGQKTGIDQPNEQKGLTKNLDTKRDIEIATASYGQGISMTPMQTIRALSILANGGNLIIPHIVNKIEYTDGTSQMIENIKTPIVSKETVDEVTEMLIQVVDKALKKGQVKMENYSIAAKTGTAQIANPETKGYYDDRFLHSFFGYFPAHNPRFIIFLYHVNPKNVNFASETLTDPFIKLTKFLINYYEIPPDR